MIIPLTPHNDKYHYINHMTVKSHTLPYTLKHFCNGNISTTMKQNSLISFNATDFLMASKLSEMQTLEYFLRMGQLVGVISDLVHALQKERGASNLYLGSKGLYFCTEREHYVAQSNLQLKIFDETLRSLHQEMIEHANNTRLLNKIAFALHAITNLTNFRIQIQQLDIPSDQAISFFSAMIGDLLDIIFETADSAVEPQIVRALLALFNLMHGKELIGQERALGAAGFSSGAFSLAQRERLLFLHDSQQRCFELFCEFADQHSIQLWKGFSLAPYFIDIERLRRFALNPPASQGCANEVQHSDIWFKSITQYMDDLKKVESGLLAHLQNLCLQRVADAKLAMTKHHDLIATLDSHPDETQIVLRSHSSTSLSSPSTSQEYFTNEGIGFRLGRSVFELVQNQAHNLQHMQDELAKTRIAIDNKKLQEKAKFLLMKHQGLLEDQAYKLLREMAMNQRKTITEIAQSIVDMTQIWQAKP